MKRIARTFILALLLPWNTMHAGESERQQACLKAAAKKDGFDAKTCAPLEAELIKIEADVQAAKKDKTWRAVCLEFAPGLCSPELDIDQDGKTDRVFLFAKGNGKAEKRMIVIRTGPGKSGLSFLEKPKDVTIGNWGPGVKFDLKKLTQWSVGSSENPDYKEFQKYCDLRDGVKVLELWNDSVPYVLSGSKGSYCYMLIGD